VRLDHRLLVAGPVRLHQRRPDNPSHADLPRREPSLSLYITIRVNGKQEGLETCARSHHAVLTVG